MSAKDIAWNYRYPYGDSPPFGCAEFSAGWNAAIKHVEESQHVNQLAQPAICPCFIDGAGCVIQETTMLCYGKPCVLDRGKRQAGAQ